jgi:hypothetical protein
MIERNLGNVERITRLLMGAIFALWSLQQPAMNGIEWLVMALSLALILNGVFSRCYLWYVIERTSTRDDGSIRAPSTC